MKTFQKRIKLYGSRAALLVIAVVLCVTSIPLSQASALDACQKKLLEKSIRWFECDISQCGDAGPTTAGSDNQETAYKFFVDKGLLPQQSAGIVGNLIEESGVDPKLPQVGGPGRGIVQWELGSDRYAGLVDFAQKRGTSWDDLMTQLEYIWYEFGHNEKNAYKKLTAEATTDGAAMAIMVYYERPYTAIHRNDQPGPYKKELGQRQKAAKDVYNRYGGYAGTADPGDPPPNPAIEGDAGNPDGVVDECGGSGSCTQDGATVTGRIAILCQARRFDPWGYLYGGGHIDQEAFMKAWEAKGGFDQTKHPFERVVDCSSIVSIAIYLAYGVRLGGFTTETYATSKYFKEIPIAQTQPGDMLYRFGHTEIVREAGGKKTFGAHTAKYPPAKQISDSQGGTYTKAYRYIGPGAEQ